MYLARYRDGQSWMIQAVVHIKEVVVEPLAQTTGWWVTFHSAVATVLDSAWLDLAYRVVVGECSLQRLVVLSGPSACEGDLIALSDSFMRLNALAEDSVEICLKREQHDALLGSFPTLRSCIQNERFSVRDCELFTDFHVYALVERIVALALRHGWTVAFQANCRRYNPSPDHLRAARKNLLRAQSDAGLPEAITRLQARITERLARGSFVLEEFIGAAEPQAWNGLFEILRDEYQVAFGRLGFPGLRVHPSSDGSLDDQIATGLHSSVFLDPDGATGLASVQTRSDVSDLVCWRPPASWDTTVLKNARVASEHERDYLRRIDERLARLERSLRSRNSSSAECGELRKALGISREDPPFALVKTRQILEGIVESIYRDRRPGHKIKPLFNMIEDLTQDPSLFPAMIASYLHTVRVGGNLVAHPRRAGEERGTTTGLDERDLETNLLMTLSIVEWFLSDYQQVVQREHKPH